MAREIRVLVLRAAGSNCDWETAHAFQLAGAQAELVHVNRLAEDSKRLDRYHILAIPGGFTYGDDVSAGKILANELKYKLGEQVQRFVDEGKLVLGICNGFQVLVKAGLLPYGRIRDGRQLVTLTFNDSGRFEDRWVYLKPDPSSPCVFTRGMEHTITLPVAHAEGKFVPADSGVLELLEANHQIVFRYVGPNGGPAPYPWNPNGSIGDVAGICDPTGRIFGLMPHPERHVDPTHHPRWTREGLRTEGDGLAIFRHAVQYAREEL
ncbi:MAG: phosphoribosylformylglycinamidine synthase I [candidate division KSB1 bacterium]|nr:phosphoribosylformylglycinamidine synthase I [candidate division KSB1 bacterium]